MHLVDTLMKTLRAGIWEQNRNIHTRPVGWERVLLCSWALVCVRVRVLVRLPSTFSLTCPPSFGHAHGSYLGGVGWAVTLNYRLVLTTTTVLISSFVFVLLCFIDWSGSVCPRYRFHRIKGYCSFSFYKFMNEWMYLLSCVQLLDCDDHIFIRRIRREFIW